ncbi:Disease resistance protein L6 [Linum perenne]
MNYLTGIAAVAAFTVFYKRFFERRSYSDESTDKSSQQSHSDPEKDVMDKLMISYNELEYEEQQIFLDIACFYIGINKELASYIWSDCEFYPIHNINILVQRSLVKIGDRNEFQMNNQVRDMGRDIVRRENVVWKRSRIWSTEAATELLLHNKGTEYVQAIRVRSSRSAVWELGKESFTNLSKLRYFDVKGIELNVDFNHLLPNLKWIELQAGRIMNFNVKNVIIFVVSGLEQDSERCIEIKASKLKVIVLHQCVELSKLPEFPDSESLEILEIDNFKNKEQNLEIGKLKNLKVLKLQHCILGKIRGGTIGMMEGLRELDVSNNFECDFDSFRQVIIDIWKLPSLQVLNVNNPRLVDVLKGIKLPKSLKLLNTSSGFENLAELLDLVELIIHESRMRFVIPQSVTWHKLRSMMLYSKEGIVMAANESTVLPSSLTRLHIQCLKSEQFPNLKNLRNLTELVLRDCQGLEEIHGLGGLKSLQILVIDVAGKLTRIDGLGDLMSSTECRLKELQITECPLLRALLTFEQHGHDRVSVRINSLIKMRINGGQFLDGKSVPRLSQFPRLKELEIGWISLNVESESSSEQNQLLEGLENLEELVQLKVHHLPKVQRLPQLSKLRKLRDLTLDNLPGLREIEGIGGLTTLKSIQVRECFWLERFPVTDLPYYYGMDRIVLDFRGCTNFDSAISDLSPLTNGGLNLDLIDLDIHLPNEHLPWWKA